MIILILVSFICILLIVRFILAEEVRRAREAYLTSLQDLKRDPTNADLKQETLRLGRYYASVSENGISELSIFNDINSVCTEINTTQENQKTINVSPTKSLEDRLKSLNDLHVRELITTSEYNEQRQRILEDV